MPHLRLPLAALFAFLCACRSGPQPSVTGAAPFVSRGGKLAVDPSRPPYQPILPRALHRQGVVVAGTFLVCAAPDGKVAEVSIIQSADPRVDADWMRTLKTWRYEPFVVAGNPLPLCHRVRLDVHADAG
jgi:hypothetical protein